MATTTSMDAEIGYACGASANEVKKLHDRRVSWDERYAVLSGVRADIEKSVRCSIGKSYTEEDAEKAALAEVEAKIEALGSRP